MKLKSVIIDGTKFIIDESKEPIFIESSRCLGIIDHTQGVISIDDSIGETIKPTVLMHEIVHGILCSRGFEELSSNEEAVEAIARGLINLINDNSELIKYINEQAKK